MFLESLLDDSTRMICSFKLFINAISHGNTAVMNECIRSATMFGQRASIKDCSMINMDPNGLHKNIATIYYSTTGLSPIGPYNFLLFLYSPIPMFIGLLQSLLSMTPGTCIDRLLHKPLCISAYGTVLLETLSYSPLMQLLSIGLIILVKVLFT